MKSADCREAISRWCSQNLEKWAINVTNPEAVINKAGKRWKRISKRKTSDGKTERIFRTMLQRTIPSPKLQLRHYIVKAIIITDEADTTILSIRVTKR